MAKKSLSRQQDSDYDAGGDGTTFAIYEALAAAEVSDSDKWHALFDRHFEMGRDLSAADIDSDYHQRSRAAREELRIALAICEKFVALDPSNAKWLTGLAESHVRLGYWHFNMSGDYAEALKEYRADLEVRKKLADRDPGDAEWEWRQDDLAESHMRIGVAHAGDGDHAEALKEYLAASDIRKILADRNAGWQRELERTQRQIRGVEALLAARVNDIVDLSHEEEDNPVIVGDPAPDLSGTMGKAKALVGTIMDVEAAALKLVASRKGLSSVAELDEAIDYWKAAKAEHTGRDTAARATAEPRPEQTVAQDAAVSDTETVRLVFGGDIPESFRTGTYTRNPHPELVHHSAVLAQAKEIVSANSRTRIGDLKPKEREALRQARRIVRANERHPGG